MATTDEDTCPDLVTLHIQVCVNCMNRTPGECHAPGCFYWMHRIEEVPMYLEGYLPGSSTDPREVIS